MEPYFVYRSELDEMNDTVLDEDTGLTEYDVFENNHYNDDSVFIVEDTSPKRDRYGNFLITSFAD